MPNQGITGVSGNDIFNFNGTVISGHADGDAYKLEPSGPIAEYKVSKDGNSIVAYKYTGQLQKVQMRLVRGCADHIMMLGRLSQWQASPNTFPLLFAEYIKSTGDSKGNVFNEVYVLSGGVFEMNPAAVTNVDGSTESSVAVFHFLFRLDAILAT